MGASTSAKVVKIVCILKGMCKIQTCLIALFTAGKSTASIEVLVKGVDGHHRLKDIKEDKGLKATSEKKNGFKDNKTSYTSRMAWEQVYSDTTSSDKSFKEPQSSKERKGRDFMETRQKESLDLMALVLNLCPVPDKYSHFKVSSHIPQFSILSGTFPGKPWHGAPARGAVVQVMSTFNRPSKVFNNL